MNTVTMNTVTVSSVNKDLMNPHPKDLLPDYVLGLLTPEEVRAVEAHLEGCAECQEDAWDLAEPLVMLTEARLDMLGKTSGERPPEGILQAVKAELAADAPLLPEIATTEPFSAELPSEVQEEVSTGLPVPRPTRYVWPFATAFALVLALGSLFWGVRTYDTLQQVRANERLLSSYLGRPEVQKVVLENVLESNRTEPIGSALLVSTSQGTSNEEVLFVLNQDAPRGRTYQAWGHTSSDWDPERGEDLENLLTSEDGVFEVDAGGFASLYLSLEPTGGSPQPTNPISKVSLLNPLSNAPLEITTPEDSTIVSTDSLIISGVVDPSIRSLSYTLNGGEPTQTSVANNRFSFTVSGLSEGRNRVDVSAKNADGETVTASVRVTYTP